MICNYRKKLRDSKKKEKKQPRSFIKIYSMRILANLYSILILNLYWYQMFCYNFRNNEDELRERERWENGQFIAIFIYVLYMWICIKGIVIVADRKICCSIQFQTNGSIPHSHFSVWQVYAMSCWLFVFNITQWLKFQLFVKQWLHSFILYRLIAPPNNGGNGQPDGKKYKMQWILTTHHALLPLCIC